MIIRYIEVCPSCGQWNPWLKVSSRIVNGRRRQYVKCRRCGRKETVEYRMHDGKAPDSGTTSAG